MNGTFCNCASRIFAPSFSFDLSTSMRSPADFNCSPTLSAYSLNFSDNGSTRLHRREPERERAGVVLDDDADETLERPEDSAMDYNRPMLFAVVVDVLEYGGF